MPSGSMHDIYPTKRFINHSTIDSGASERHTGYSLSQGCGPGCDGGVLVMELNSRGD